MSSDLFFASSNRNKFEEAKCIASEFGIRLRFLRTKLGEIQADSLEEIARHKAIEAFSMCSKPVLVEDAGLFIKSLGGFPGPYSSYVLDTIGNKGILRLVGPLRSATFRSVIAYCGKRNSVHVFSAGMDGTISKKEMGSRWGFDPIFVPSGQDKSYSQLADKNKMSHRYLAVKKFASWYLGKRRSSGL